MGAMPSDDRGDTSSSNERSEIQTQSNSSELNTDSKCLYYILMYGYIQTHNVLVSHHLIYLILE